MAVTRRGISPAALFCVRAACVLAVWSVLPLSMLWDGVPAAYYADAWGIWGWSAVIAGLAVALVLVLSKGRAPAFALGVWRQVMRIPTPVFVVVASLLLATLTVLCTLFVFDGNPRNVDGFAQLFQARIFLARHLWMTPPAELSNFATLQMILGPDKWLSQYPPGQSVVLALGILAGAWWLLNPLIAVVFAVSTYRVARWCAGESAARLTMLLLCASPFAVAVAGSEMSHLGAAALGMTASWLAVRAVEKGSILTALSAALLLGLMTTFRPLDAVAATLTVGVILWYWSPRRWVALAAAGAGGIIGAIPTLWFNARANGSPTRFGYTVLWGPQHSLGFHDVPFGQPLTLTRAIARSGMDLHQLNAGLLDCAIPILVIVAIGYVAGRRLLESRDAVPFAGVFALVGLIFFYWHRDVFYGPRFLYSAVAWFVILLARSIVLLSRSGTPKRPELGLTGAFAVMGAIIFGLVQLTPTRITAYKRSTPIFSLHPAADVARAGVSHAVVVVPDGWGSRLIAHLWQLGIPVRRSTKLYAGIDACTLEGMLDAADTNTTARETLMSNLYTTADRHDAGVKARVTDDANLRLPADSAKITPACRQEIAVDRRGFFQYAPDLWLNNATLDGDVVWARDMGPANAALFARYTGRRFFRYAPDSTGAPVLMPLAGPGW